MICLGVKIWLLSSGGCTNIVMLKRFYVLHILFQFTGLQEDWVTADMPALADVMSKVLRKRVKNDQV